MLVIIYSSYAVCRLITLALVLKC